ncbi:MAG: glycosyltransferase [Planctomycetia bacterium]|nr:glycosyltransferase [Planctomycetia bacterium]
MSMQGHSGRPRRLSVVVPATDVSALEETLVSVLEHRPDACDVIVAISVPYDDPWNIREEVTFVDVPKATGLVDCINAGIAASTGDVVHVLAAGWKATAGWTDRPLEHFATSSVGAVVPLAVSESDRDQPVSAGIRRTAGGRSVPVVPRRNDAGGITMRVSPSAPAIEAGFWRADMLATIGFSKACGDSLAAADMAAALAAAKLDVVVESESRVVSGPVQRRGGGFTAGLHAERLFWRSLPCERLVPALIAHAGEVMRHAAATAPLGTLGMLAGRLAALVQLGSCVPRTRQLAQLMSQQGKRPVAGNASARMLRIDGPHEAPARPYVDSSVPALKRSA